MGPPLIFFGPQNLLWHQKPHFWGVKLLTFFDPSYGLRDFWGGWCQNVEFSTPKAMLGSKNVRIMTPPKVRFLSPNNALGGPNRF